MSASSVASSTPQATLHASSFESDAPTDASPVGHAGSVAGLDSNTLLKGQKAVTIVHNGTPYRLQATKLGKLILTK